MVRERIEMTVRETEVFHIIRSVIEKGVKQVRAAALLDMSVRQIRRLIQRVKEHGSKGVIHGSRGRESNRRIQQGIRVKVVRVCRAKYGGFGPTLASEKLAESEGIQISDETLRRWFIQEGIRYKHRRKRPHRSWRARKEHFGEMVQMDGSHHDWLEGRGARMVLMAYIDDATGTVFGRFYDYEGTIPAMDSFRGYIEKYGIPCCVYSDQHSAYKVKKRLSVEEELNGQEEAWSQFRRALEELAVRLIYANSAPAKGRIERVFGTLQDRLVKEMRLRGINCIDQANVFLDKYLPIFNKKFSVSAARKGDLHRPIPGGMDLDWVFCKKVFRTLKNDNTIAFEGKHYQVINRTASRRITIEISLNGSLRISCGKKQLKYKELESRPKEVIERFLGKSASHVAKRHAPRADHPWIGFTFGRNEPSRRALNESG